MMRKPTGSEAFFLAATLTAASLTTLEITPKVIEICRKQSVATQIEVKRRKMVDPSDAFSTGFLLGGGVGAFATLKLIAAKINGCP